MSLITLSFIFSFSDFYVVVFCRNSQNFLPHSGGRSGSTPRNLYLRRASGTSPRNRFSGGRSGSSPQFVEILGERLGGFLGSVLFVFVLCIAFNRAALLIKFVYSLSSQNFVHAPHGL